MTINLDARDRFKIETVLSKLPETGQSKYSGMSYEQRIEETI